MKLFYRKMGKGAPVLILHGLFGISDNWISIAKQLADNYCIYIPDMRNHGRSPHSHIFTYSAMVDDLYEFLTDLNLHQIALIGHSMGGLAAVNFALEYPHRIRALINTIPAASHWIHSDAPNELIALIRSFLKTEQVPM